MHDLDGWRCRFICMLDAANSVLNHAPDARIHPAAIAFYAGQYEPGMAVEHVLHIFDTSGDYAVDESVSDLMQLNVLWPA